MAKVWNKRDRNVPTDAVYVGRPSPVGNPFVIGKDGDRAEVIEKYREWFMDRVKDEAFAAKVRQVLTGRDLVCWCAPEPCHADVILEWLGQA